MKIVFKPVLFITPENATIELNDCRARSFSAPTFNGVGRITRASLVVPWENYGQVLNAWRNSDNPRKCAWLKASLVQTFGLSDGYDTENWLLDPPYLVDEASAAGVAIFHLKRYDGAPCESRV